MVGYLLLLLLLLWLFSHPLQLYTRLYRMKLFIYLFCRFSSFHFTFTDFYAQNVWDAGEEEMTFWLFIIFLSFLAFTFYTVREMTIDYCIFFIKLYRMHKLFSVKAGFSFNSSFRTKTVVLFCFDEILLFFFVSNSQSNFFCSHEKIYKHRLTNKCMNGWMNE